MARESTALLAFVTFALVAGCTADGTLSPAFERVLARAVECQVDDTACQREQDDGDDADQAAGASGDAEPGGDGACDDPILCADGSASGAAVASAPAPIPAKWAGRSPAEPVSCSSGSHLISDAIIDTTGDAIVASGSCQVRLKNSFVRGSRAAALSGSARLSISDSRLVGSDGTAAAVDAGTLLSAKRTEFGGAIKGSWKDNGGNVFD